MTTKISEQQYCEIVTAIVDNHIIDKHDREYAISYNSVFGTLSELLKAKLGIEVECSQIDECDWNPVNKQVPSRYINSIVVVKTQEHDDSLLSYSVARLESVQPLIFKDSKSNIVNAKYWKLLYNFSV